MAPKDCFETSFLGKVAKTKPKFFKQLKFSWQIYNIIHDAKNPAPIIIALTCVRNLEYLIYEISITSIC